MEWKQNWHKANGMDGAFFEFYLFFRQSLAQNIFFFQIVFFSSSQRPEL